MLKVIYQGFLSLGPLWLLILRFQVFPEVREPRLLDSFSHRV